MSDMDTHLKLNSRSLPEASDRFHCTLGYTVVDIMTTSCVLIENACASLSSVYTI